MSTTRTSLPIEGNAAGRRFCRLELAGSRIFDVRCHATGAICLWRFDRFVAIYFPRGAPQGAVTIDVEHAAGSAPAPAGRARWFNDVLQPPDPIPAPVYNNIRNIRTESGTFPEQVPPRDALASALSDLERLSLLLETTDRDLLRRMNAAKMFREFDRYTHAAFGDGQVFILPRRPNYSLDVAAVYHRNEYAFRHSIIHRTMADLFRRSQQRCLRRESEDRAARQPKIFEPWVAYLSALQLLFYRRWYDGLADEQDWARLFEAFVWFGSGALTFRFSAEEPYDKLVSPLLSQGAPDGTPIVLFAEFAISAVETDTHPRAWAQLLPGLIAMVRAYGLAYLRGDELLGSTARIDRIDAATHARLVEEAVADLRKVRAARSDDELRRIFETQVQSFNDLLSGIFPNGLAMTGDRAALADPNRGDS